MHVAMEITKEQIALRAYERFVARGGEHGHDLEDWIAAEADLRASMRFDVVLLAPGAKEIEVMRTIRDLTNLPLRAIKTAMESAPRTIKRAATQRTAEMLRSRLEKLGARVDVRVSD
jgi:ribosomal protein L7/L12